MSKKELERAYLKAKEEIERLREELAYVKFELEELRSKRYKSGGKKPPGDDTPSEAPKKRGGLFGHIGWFRKKPDRIDRIEEVRLDKCPECGSNDLTKCGKVHEHIQEDIILPQVEVTLYRKHRYYCKRCKRVVSSKGKDEILGSYIGPKAKQRCLVHILRDLKKVMEYWHDDKEVMSYCRRLKKIFEDAIRLYKDYAGKRWDDGYLRRRRSIAIALRDFSFPNPNKRILTRFAKRLERHKNEILTFLYRRGIDYHNNHAEQQIRPDVIFRKITFGNRSPVGAENHSVIMSILQTAKLNGIDPLAAMGKILLRSPENPLAKALSP